MCLPGPDEPDPLRAHLLHWEGWGEGLPMGHPTRQRPQTPEPGWLPSL